MKTHIYYLKKLLCHFPRTYLFLQRIHRRKHPSLQNIVGPDTDLTIEGFPRSANSYLSRCLRTTHGQLGIATHLHHPANYLESVRLNIPTIVCIREPYDAILSWIALEHQSGTIRNTSEKHIEGTFLRLCSYFCDFNQPLLYLRGNSAILCPFEQSKDDINLIVKETNEVFSKDFQMISEDIKKGALEDRVAYHVGPNEEREELKLILNKLCKPLKTSNSYLRAYRCYEEVLKKFKKLNYA